MADVGRHPNIELLAYSEVENVTGYVGNFTVTVRKKARYVDVKRVHRLRRLRGGVPGRRARRVRAGPRDAQGHLPAVPSGGPLSVRPEHRRVPGQQPHRVREVSRGLRQEVHRLRRRGRAGLDRGRHHHRLHRHGRLRPDGAGRVRLHAFRERHHVDGVRAAHQLGRADGRPPRQADRPRPNPGRSRSSSAWGRGTRAEATRTAATSAA